MTELFSVDRTVITRHVNSVFKEKEQDRESNVQKMHIANSDRPVQFICGMLTGIHKDLSGEVEISLLCCRLSC